MVHSNAAKLSQLGSMLQQTRVDKLNIGPDEGGHKYIIADGQATTVLLDGMLGLLKALDERSKALEESAAQQQEAHDALMRTRASMQAVLPLYD